MSNEYPTMFIIDYRQAYYDNAYEYDLPNYAHLCPYINLVWHRRLTDAGQFSVQVAVRDLIDCGISKTDNFGEIFNFFQQAAIDGTPMLIGLNQGWLASSYAYRFCDVGMVQAVEFDEDSQTAQLSGFFLDQMADGIITTKRVEQTSGIMLSTLATQLVTPVSSGSRWIRDTKYGLSGMPINSVSVTAAPKASEKVYVDFGPTSVGKKLRLLCGNRNIGLRTKFTNAGSNHYLLVDLNMFQGLDRSISQTSRESVVLADSIGTARAGKMSFDASGYSSRVYASGYDSTKTSGYSIVFAYSPYTTSTAIPYMNNFLSVIDETSTKATTALESNDLISKMNDETRDKANQFIPEFNVSVEAEANCGYGEKFHLGDTITTRISGNLWDAVVTEVTETWKSGGYSLEIVLGTQRRSNIAKAIERIS